ncbi:unnamed protein product [Ilex paraguariensis]|uniref:Uncharacterized protein n=1 Tax=Ilex paraguariensis TaxID=185542 RepID=A0ABC8TQI5_9AQUA
MLSTPAQYWWALLKLKNQNYFKNKKILSAYDSDNDQQEMKVSDVAQQSMDDLVLQGEVDEYDQWSKEREDFDNGSRVRLGNATSRGTK